MAGRRGDARTWHDEETQQTAVESRCAMYEQQIEDLQRGLQQTVALLEDSHQNNADIRSKLGTMGSASSKRQQRRATVDRAST